MTIQFWSNQPTILFDKEYIFELWPTKEMCYEQKLNSITRLVILLTILGYILTRSLRILGVGIITLLIIFILFTMRKQKVTKEMLKESFGMQTKTEPAMVQNTSYINPVTLDSVLKSEFKQGNRKNPFSNVLLTQISDDPDRKSAPPSFNVDVEEDITKNVKKAVQMMNPDIKNTDKQLFGDMWQDFELDQSNRVFFSTANTKIQPGDQASFGKYLYGNMPSAKESTPEGNMQRYADSYRYTLY
jgi:hypothetical protein